MKRSLGLIGLLVTTMATSPSYAADSIRQIAESTAAQWNAAFANGKVDAILSLYADNALLLQPNGAVSKSPGEIREFWQTLIQRGDYAMDIVDVRGEQDGTIVATAKLSGVQTVENRAPRLMTYRYGGVLYNVLTRQPDGTWKAKVQRWSEDRRI